MKNSGLRAAVFSLVLAAAIGCIGFGIYKSWGAFLDFDESILKEKDSQFYSLIRSNDINIQNSIEAFTREAEILFTRDTLNELVSEWRESGDKSDLQDYFDHSALENNPVYAGMVMIRKGSIVLTSSADRKLEFITEPDGSGLRICKDSKGKYYISYEYRKNKNITYDALIDLGEFYTNALGDDPNRGLMLLDSTSTLMLRKPGNEVLVSEINDEIDSNASKCMDYLAKCQKEQKSGGISIELTDDSGKTYTARMVVVSSGETENAEFAVGITANYDQALAPSRAAAKQILIYGGVCVLGIIMIIALVLMMHRINAANKQELAALKKKNETLAEINQQMQALSHHQRLETIGTMTASIAHDFNNLLTPIMGYSIMTMEMLPADATDIQENLMEVYNASVKAKDIVSRLSDLSKKSREEDYVELNLDEIVKSSLKVTLPAKPEKVEVKVRFKSGRNKVKGDRTQLSQLVINIVLNAYDAMRETGGSLLISTRAENGNITLKFRDTGMGMSPETVSRIFDPFYTTKESGKGTGLGLAIVAQIVETHGGRIYVDSQPGEGTEFRIVLPICETVSPADMKKTIVFSN